MKRRESLMGLMGLASGLSSCSLVRRAEPVDGRASATPRRSSATPMPPAAPVLPAPPGAAQQIPQQIAGPTRTSYSSCQVAGPFLAMTFDDGPQPSNTPRLLGLLRERNLKGTFFVIGRSVNAYPHVLAQTLAEGHEIANHTLTHANLTKLSDAGVAREIEGCNQAIANATGGYKPQVMRPPGGALTTRQREWVKQEFGLPTIMWSLDPDDWRKPYRNADIVARHMLEGWQGSGPPRAGHIILCHDLHATTVAAMPQVLDTLVARGFQFVTVGQLINLENGMGGALAATPEVTRFTAGSL
jgi:peptidoglycan/xylan/chitin deacetylase (PgdA/CDA1 family)